MYDRKDSQCDPIVNCPLTMSIRLIPPIFVPRLTLMNTAENHTFHTWVRYAHEYLNPALSSSNFALLKNKQFIDFMERAPCTVFVMNHATSQYEFFSKNVEHLMGYTTEEMLAGGMQFGTSLADPKQHQVLSQELFPAIFHHLQVHAKKGELREIRLAFNFRFIRKDGSARWAMQHLSVLEADENGTPFISLVFMYDVTEFKKDELVDFSVSKLDSNGYYLPVFSTTYPQEREKIQLTRRESELIPLINQGKTSEEIATILYLSVHTVRSHRKKIMHKFGASTTPGLLNIFRAKGLL